MGSVGTFQTRTVISLFGIPVIRPVSEEMYEVTNRLGIQSAVRTYNSLKASDSSDYDFGESELNSLGYQLLGDHRTNEAVEIFQLNTNSYPNSSNAFDSLGEALLKSGNKEL